MKNDWLEKSLKLIKDARLDIELLNKQNEKLCSENNIKISELQTTIGLAEEGLEIGLTESGEKKLECKLGYVSYREMPDCWDYGEEAIHDIHVIYPKDVKRYIKTTETLIKTNIKEDCLSGKIGLPSITVTKQAPKFNYKIRY